MQPKHYDFHSTWLIPAPLEQAWGAVIDPGTWTSWWTGLENATVIHHEPAIIGSKTRCTWRSATGYHLQLVITITAYKEQQLIAFTSEGDLAGSGSWTFQEVPGNTKMEILWNVATQKDWMNLLSPILKPLFIRNHDSLMHRGESGLITYLRSKAVT